METALWREGGVAQGWTEAVGRWRWMADTSSKDADLRSARGIISHQFGGDFMISLVFIMYTYWNTFFNTQRWQIPPHQDHRLPLQDLCQCCSAPSVWMSQGTLPQHTELECSWITNKISSAPCGPQKVWVRDVCCWLAEAMFLNRDGNQWSPELASLKRHCWPALKVYICDDPSSTTSFPNSS